MSNLEFEDQGIGLGAYKAPVSRESKIVQLLIDRGIANNRSQANYILIGISLFFFIITIFILLFTFKNEEQSPPSQRVIEITNRMNNIRK